MNPHVEQFLQWNQESKDKLTQASKMFAAIKTLCEEAKGLNPDEILYAALLGIDAQSNIHATFFGLEMAAKKALGRLAESKED